MTVHSRRRGCRRFPSGWSSRRQRSYRASVHVKRVRLSRGASPPGRRPRRTSSVGGRAPSGDGESRSARSLPDASARRARRRAARPRPPPRSRRPRPARRARAPCRCRSRPAERATRSRAAGSHPGARWRRRRSCREAGAARSVRPRSRRRSPRRSNRGRLHRTARAPDGRDLASTRLRHGSRARRRRTGHARARRPRRPPVHPRRAPPEGASKQSEVDVLLGGKPHDVLAGRLGDERGAARGNPVGGERGPALSHAKRSLAEQPPARERARRE